MFDYGVYHRDEPRSPLSPGILLGMGSAVMVLAAFTAAALGPSGSIQRLLLMALAVAVGAAAIPDWRFGLALAVIGYLLYVGFLVNQYGELRWDGNSDLRDFGLFVLAFWFGIGRRLLRSNRRSSSHEGDSESHITTSSG